MIRAEERFELVQGATLSFGFYDRITVVDIEEEEVMREEEKL